MKSYKAIYRYLLTFTVLFSALPSISMAQPQDPSTMLLQANFQHNSLMRKLSQSTSLALESCLCQSLPQNSPSKASCNSTREIQSFTKQYYNALDQFVSIDTSCSQLIESLLKKPIRENFQQMRIDLALSSPDFTGKQNLKMEFDSPTETQFKIKLNPQHPVYESITGIAVKSLTAWNLEKDNELIQTALNEYARARNDACVKYALNLAWSNDDKQRLIKTCSGFAKNGYHKTLNSYYVDQQASYKYVKEIEALMPTVRHEIQKEKFKSYIGLVTKQPFLLLVDSPNPSNEELLKVVRDQRNYRGAVVKFIDGLEQSTPTEEDLMVLVQLNRGISTAVVDRLEKRYPQIDWFTTKQELEFQLKKSDSSVATSLIGGSCLIATRGIGAAFCGGILVSYSMAKEFSDFNSSLRDILSRIDRDLAASENAEDDFMQRLENMDAMVLSNLILITPALKSLNQAQKAKVFQLLRTR